MPSQPKPTCPNCGVPIPPGAPEGLCPRCLIKGGMGSELADGGQTMVGGDTTPAAVGERIGRYKLLQEIGEDGFVGVYMAEQTGPVKRRVALKVIKPGMDSKEVIARSFGLQEGHRFPADACRANESALLS